MVVGTDFDTTTNIYMKQTRIKVSCGEMRQKVVAKQNADEHKVVDHSLKVIFSDSQLALVLQERHLEPARGNQEKREPTRRFAEPDQWKGTLAAVPQTGIEARSFSESARREHRSR